MGDIAQTIASPPGMIRPAACIGPAQARRLCLSLIDAEQDRLQRAGKLSPAQRIRARMLDIGPEDLNALPLTEAELGFDSLSMLDLVLSANRYFGLSDTGIEDYLLVRPTLGDWAMLVAEHFNRMGGKAHITFSTSGSTGTPKAIRHPMAALLSEAQCIAETVLGMMPADGRVLCCVPAHHIYGFLWGGLAPALAGRTVVDLAGRTPEGMLRAAQGGDILLATPFLWARMGQAGPELPQGVAGVTSGAPSDKDTWAASHALGLIRLTEVYGASETGGVGMRTAEDAPFALMPDIRRQAQDLWRPGAPAPLPLQDDLAWISPTDFTVQGRKDHMVQVGGINVSPAAVARALEDSGLAQEAAVRLEGDRLKAFVVPASPAPADLETALRQAVAHMPAPARPTRFTFGAALPRGATGKITDW